MPTNKPTAVDLGFAISLPPKDAIAYFASKGYTLSHDWQEVWQQAHAKAFTVAKASRMEVLEAISGELSAALNDGLTEYEFKRRLSPRLKALGWWGQQVQVDSQGNAEVLKLGSPHRLKTIYRTNLQSSYMAGRYRQQLANAKQRPYWMYVAVMDGATRPSHRLLNGRVFHYTDPIWQTHYPPNGWGCRCRVRALSERQLKRLGLTVESSAGLLASHQVEAGVSKSTGEVYQAEVTTFKDSAGSLTPDKGWSYNVGQSAFGSDMAMAQKLGQVQDVAVRSQAIQALNNSELRQQAFAQWVDEVLDKRRPGHGVQTLGFMDEVLHDALAQRLGFAPARVMVMGEKHLLHADSPKHQRKGVTLSREQYQALPQMLAKPELVLWDKRHQNLLFVFTTEEARDIKIVVDAPLKLKGQQSLLDVVINTYKVNRASLQRELFEVLQGSWD